MEWLQSEQTARGTHKRNLSARNKEGYRITMETDSPTPVADGGGEGTGGLGVVMAGSRDDYLGFPPKTTASVCLAETGGVCLCFGCLFRAGFALLITGKAVTHTKLDLQLFVRLCCLNFQIEIS